MHSRLSVFRLGREIRHRYRFAFEHVHYLQARSLSRNPASGEEAGFSTENPLKVLFCGRNFPYALEYTKNELETRGIDNIVCTSCDEADVSSEIENSHVVVPLMMRIAEEHLMTGKVLRCILQYGVGLEGVDIEAATRNKVHVSNIPSHMSGNAEATAEHALHLVLSALRHPALAQKIFNDGKLGEPITRQILRKRVLILGFGSVGQEIFKRIAAFCPSEVIGIKNTQLSCDELKTLRGYLGEGSTLTVKTGEHNIEKLLEKVDIVIISSTLTESTRGIVNRDFCAALKHGTVVVNIARGQIVENEAILEALNSGQVGFFASDVGCTLNGAVNPLFSAAEPFPASDPLALHPNTLFTPHNGGIADVSYHNMARIVADAAIRISNNEPPAISVNGPF